MKIGREEVYWNIAGKNSLHEFNNDNGNKLIDFAGERNLVIKSTMFPRKDIYKQTWISPDGMVLNQIDHVLIGRRHASDIIDVRSRRGPDCNSDHYLVQIKYRQRITKNRQAAGTRKIRYDIDKLKKAEVANNFEKEMDNKLREIKIGESTKSDIMEQWNFLREAITEIAESILGQKKKDYKKREWFDEECKAKIQERNIARLNWIQKKTRASADNFKTKRKEATKTCRKKRRNYLNSMLMELNEWEKDDTRRFYARVRNFKKGYQPRTDFCRDTKGTLIGDKRGILDRWAEHFGNLLKDDEEASEQQEGIRILRCE